MKIKNCLCLVTLILTSSIAFAQDAIIITSYQHIFNSCFDQQKHLSVGIRSFNFNDVPYLLVVNPNNFATEIVPAAKMTCSKDNNLRDTPYAKALKRYSSPPYKMQNYGLAKSEKSVNGMFITIDMCPTPVNKPFAQKLFKELSALGEREHKAIPIAISISGLWITKHKQDFIYLTQQKNLSITWINHSFDHFYLPDVPLDQNFLLAPNSDLSREILDTEKLLLENGQMPSVFFRFPGLVSDENLVRQLASFGLISVGTSAWLAEGDMPKNGSIILVHGNGNESAGVQMLILLLNFSRIEFFPLVQALSDRHN